MRRAINHRPAQCRSEPLRPCRRPASGVRSVAVVNPHFTLWAVLPVFALGCAPARTAGDGALADGDPLTARGSHWDGPARSQAAAPSRPAFGEAVGDVGSTRLFESDTPVRSFETTRIADAEPPARATRPPRRARISLDLRAAPFEDVARLLSDAGHFNLVLDCPSSLVTVTLRDVEPYDALVSLAELRGLSVRYERGVARVSSGG